MVRRWSRVTLLDGGGATFVGRQHFMAFRLFRKLTRFKRFTFGSTKFRRRSWFRLKSRKNWAHLHFTLGWGLEIYRSIRTVYKYQFYKCILRSTSPSFIGPWAGETNFIFSELEKGNYVRFIAARMSALVRQKPLIESGPYVEEAQNPVSVVPLLSLLRASQDSSYTYGVHWVHEIRVLLSLCAEYDLERARQIYIIFVLLCH